MTTVPFNENGSPVEPIIPPRPTLFTGTELIVFDDDKEYYDYMANLYPVNPEPDGSSNG
jgi:hypothetical protein